ncbi:MAG: hypothetical protein AAF842_10700 [Planctomycetota bacterium]
MSCAAQPCTLCGAPTTDAVLIRKKWVSWGPVEPYGHRDGNGRFTPAPVEVPCHQGCKGGLLDRRAKFFAVLDQTCNTHRDFVRVKGQRGYIDQDNTRHPCWGWQTADEAGVSYIPHPRYEAFA